MIGDEIESSLQEPLLLEDDNDGADEIAVELSIEDAIGKPFRNGNNDPPHGISHHSFILY